MVRGIGDGRDWTDSLVNSTKQFRYMGVTYSSAGEYGNSIGLLSSDREPS
jgi:hypothetical protein